MNEPTAYSRKNLITGWLLAAAYTAHQLITINMPRTDKALPMRETLRGWHYLAGTLLLVLVIVRLVQWRRESKALPAGLPPLARSWSRALTFALYLALAISPFLGMLNAWATGLHIHLGPTPNLPDLVEKDRDLWLFAGYFHSGIGSSLTLLNLATVLTAGYFTLRHGRGLLSGFAPGFGAVAFAGTSITVYAFSTFRSPEPGPRNVAIFWAICAGIALVGWLIHRSRGGARSFALGGVATKAVAGVFVAAIVTLGLYGPYAMFRVKPFATGEIVAGPKGATSHELLPGYVTLPVETEFDRTKGQATYKWCRFCHTVEKGGEHLVGPNLYGIFGQKAGTAPNFPYSKAMANARDKGLVWDDTTIAAYIEHTDKFMPGTAMIISSGPVSDPAVRKSVVDILKRETMKDAAR